MPTVTSEDREAAHHLLVRLRYNNPQYKSPSAGLTGKLKSRKARTNDSNPANFIFSQKELNSGAQVAIHKGSSVSVIDALISMGADINVSREATENFLKKIHGHDTQDQRSDYLKTAAANRRLDIVRLLTSRGADKISLAQGLREAVDRQYPEIVNTLLQRGADPNAGNSVIFQTAVHSDRLDIITLLLRAPTKILQTYITANLSPSVDSHNTKVVDLLVDHNADVNHEQGEALKKATVLGDPSLLLAILKGKPSTENISACVGLLFDDVGQRSIISEKHLLLEILLCAGAQGDICAESLIKAVTAGYSEIVLLLLKHQVSVNYKNAKAMDIAISKADAPMTQLLLRGSLDKKYLEGLFERIPTAAPCHTIYDITALLVNAGTTGTPLDSALIGCVLRNDYDTASLLIDYKASIEFKDSQALQMATKAGDMRMIDILLKGHPTAKSLGLSFPLIPRTSKDVKLYMTKCFLRAGAVGEPVSAALIEALLDQNDLRDMDLITFLIDNKADPNYCDGKCLQIAARSGDLVVLELLLRSRPLPTSLSTAIPYAMALKDDQRRIQIIRILLEGGARGDAVAQALADTLECDPPDKDLAKLLVGFGADINYNNGRALHAAIENCSADLVHLILSCSSSTEATKSKALSTTFNLSISERLKKIAMLLRAGVESTVIDQGFATEMQLGQFADPNILRLLLSFRGDVNRQKGQALQIAASQGLLKHLEILVTGNPNAASLRAAFPHAISIKDDSKRFETVQMLLMGGAYLAPPNDLTCSEEIQEALILETQRRTPNQRLIEILVQYGANPSWNDGEALRIATSSGLLDILRVFLTKHPSSEILAKAMPIALQLPRSHPPLRRDVIGMLLGEGINGGALDLEVNKALSVTTHEVPLDHELLAILLEYGADVNHDGGACFLHIVHSADCEALKLLTSHSPSQKTINSAFNLMTEPNKGISWKVTSRNDILDIILHAGVSKMIKNATLVKASQRSEELPARGLVYLLLKHGASIDTEQGICLQISAERGDYQLAKAFLESNPSKDTVSMAFPKVFMAKIDENSLIHITNLFLEHGVRPQVENIGPAPESPLVLALTKHSNAPRLARLLVDAGFPVNSAFLSTLQSFIGPEYVTPLLWVLCRSETTMSHRDLITSFIKADAAAQKWDVGIVNDLIEHTADIYAEDIHGRTALSYAAERGALPIMERIVKAGFPCTDQSLHYAAKGLYSKCVKFLLDNGADPDFPSIASNGLTPLGELCKGSLCQRDQLSDLKSTIRILISAGADPGIRVDGKSALLLALDNPRPVELTKALLESGLRKTINNDCHLYTTPNGLCYSPTMYVLNGCNAADVSHAHELVRLLKIFGCMNRFYNSGGGGQPSGACGLPRWIIEQERQRQHEIRRQRAEEQAELQRQREIEREREREEAREREVRRRLEVIQQERELLRLRQEAANYNNQV
ncbi:ankyrin [Glonium stellatum]|uniref:Ankyrin n=1 Tax=Glonium stellatum TaxID=574774 RepID=A0A8E2ET94_9PEZI|nr:ankyrin [Glonium stellatum]